METEPDATSKIMAAIVQAIARSLPIVPKIMWIRFGGLMRLILSNVYSTSETSIVTRWKQC